MGDSGFMCFKDWTVPMIGVFLHGWVLKQIFLLVNAYVSSVLYWLCICLFNVHIP